MVADWIKRDGVYKTRNGLMNARVIYVDDAHETYPVIAIIGKAIFHYTAKGEFFPGQEDPIDLTPPKRKVWVNVYEKNLVSGTWCTIGSRSREAADAEAALYPALDRIACVEVTEGDGL